MLEASNLTKSFGPMTVVNDLSVTVRPGTCLGIMGPNGAGKTTFFDLLSNTTEADLGTVTVGGHNVTKLSTADRVRHGLVRTFQIPRVFQTMTVAETLSLAQHAAHGHSRQQAAERVDEILEMTGLSQHRQTLGGQLRLLDRKRLELARALAADPMVILLDEISGGLTDNEVILVIELILELKDAGLTVLWIEHIAHALKAASDRILMLHLGQKLIEDEPDIVIANEQVRSLYLGTSLE